MEEYEENFSIGDIVRFKIEAENDDINKALFYEEFEVIRLDVDIGENYALLLIKVDPLKEPEWYFSSRFELVTPSKQLSVESLIEYEGMFE